jgi:hypothetical protein
MDPYSPYKKGKREKKSRHYLARFSRIFWRIFLSVQHIHIVFEVFFLGGPYNSTNLAHFSRHKFGGTVWVL